MSKNNDAGSETNEQEAQAANATLPASRLGDVTTEELYRELIYRFDRDPSRDGLLRTPSAPPRPCSS
ncbi:hypothetical protein [Acidipila sp. EB88]|uniref:hypothetical protein n=1 Tax=Acidipila sp. EB88 TaxID=2305226 RepID=UPI0026D35AC0